MTQSNSKGFGFIILLLFITLSVSFWQTGIGYKLMAGGVLTWVLSGIITLSMFFVNLSLRSNRQANQGVLGLLLAFGILAFFSFVGNFNAFYSRSMEKELYDGEMRVYQATVPALAKKAEKALIASKDYPSIEAKVKPLQRTLKMQIKDPADCGYGIEAKKIAKDINEVLGIALTPLDGNNCNEVAEAMDSQINGILEELKTTAFNDIDPIIQSIKDKERSANTILKEALEPSVIQSKGLGAIKEANRMYNSICQDTKELIPSFECKNKDIVNLQVGQITHTFKSAFVEKKNSSATVFSAVISLFIDFLVPILILLTVKPQRNAPNNQSTPNNVNAPIPLRRKRNFLERLFSGGGNNNKGITKLK